MAQSVGLELQASINLGGISTLSKDNLESWLLEGRAGEMDYLPRRQAELNDPQHWKPWARGMLCFAAPYRRPAGGFKGGGKVARYALGKDYHNVLGRRLEKLGKRLRSSNFCERYRGVTDAAPLLEREWAITAELGFRGKNTLTLNPQRGSWQILAELLIDRELPVWSQFQTLPNCGSCTSCLDSCPTNAFDGAYLMDPRKCISYLTIETKGIIPRQFRVGIGEWVFGCDICQEVCPFGEEEENYAEEWGTVQALNDWSLEDLLMVSEKDFNTAFAGSPIRRPGWSAILRNACIVLGNLKRGERELCYLIEHHPSEIVRTHAVWALGEMGTNSPLKQALRLEKSPLVLEELAHWIN